ncbi:MAG: glycosyltransferase family 4 protein [Candidatus Aminicenantales bacterium]
MKIAALLPHVEVFGGVRRYIEVGNELVKRGHSFVLFHPQGDRPVWLDFYGHVRPFSALEENDFDVGLCSEYSLLPFFEKLRARNKFFYFILKGHKKEKEVVRKNYFFLGNSEGICRRLERKYRVMCLRAPGGINPDVFHPLEKEAGETEKEGFHILCYGRVYRKRKGVRRVIQAVDRLAGEFPQLRLIFFDTLVGEDRKDPRPMIKTRVPHEFHLNLPQSRMAWLYSRADLFISAERRAGWSNTTAEAMACRIPVVCTNSGTRDFAFHNRTALVVPVPLPCLLRRQIKRLIRDEELRRRLAEAGFRKIQEFSWTALASRLEKIFQSVQKLK